VLARALSGAVLGIHAYLVTVEADVASGLPAFSTVGLPQGAVKEGRERVIAAVQNSGHIVPPKRITINLAPAEVTIAKNALELTGCKAGPREGAFDGSSYSAVAREREDAGL
jgi:magnesium chelatase family protein